MIVTAQHSYGSIGGGHLEFEACKTARGLLASDSTNSIGRIVSHNALQRHYALGPSLGQCCGGTVNLTFAFLFQDSLDTWPNDPPLFRLALFGAGHVGRAMMQALTPIHCEVWWVDERQDQFDLKHQTPVLTQQICTDLVVAEIASLPSDTMVIICTHSHALDLELCESALKREDLPWIGLIGSATKKARFLHRLQHRGRSQQQLSRLICPIGLPGILGKEPEVIAASVLAQLLQMSSTASGLHTPSHRTMSDTLDV